MMMRTVLDTGSVPVADALGMPGGELQIMNGAAARDGSHGTGPACEHPGSPNGAARPEPTGIGHNSGADDPVARKAYLVGAINDWIVNRQQREADYMRPEEIGAAENRPFLLLRALLDGVAHIQRSGVGDSDERGAGYVAAVYIVDTVLADNGSGCSTVSASRTGALLGCSEKTVRRARDILVENRVLGRRKVGGIEDRHWPIISRALAREATNVFWWLDATSEPTKRGRPAQKTPDPIRSSLYEKNPGPNTVQGLEKPRTQIAKTPDRIRSDELTIELTQNNTAAFGEAASTSQDTAPSRSGRTSPTKADIDAGFDEWWRHYPRKDDKLDAKKAYVACLTAKDAERQATIPQLLAAVKSYRFPAERKYTKLPATWLNKGSWKDASPQTFEEELREMQRQNPAAPADVLRDAVAESRRGRGID